MPRNIDPEKDQQILTYLKSHTWIETQKHFAVSPRAIKLIKDRNPAQELPQQGITDSLKNAIKILFDEMWDSLSVKQQETIMEKHSTKITEIMEALK